MRAYALQIVPSVLAVLVSGCRFERRPDLPLVVDPIEDVVVRPGLSATPMEDSVRAVAGALDEALAVGDVSRVARLTVLSTQLIDQEEAVHWTRSDPEGPLPRPLASRGEGLGWRLEGSRFTPLEGGGILLKEYRAVVSGEEVPWSAVETYVLVRVPEGWRVAHLHRSRGRGGEGQGR